MDHYYNSFLTPTAISNLKIKKAVSKKDPRQAIGEPYSIPDEKARLLAAKLILEESLETVKAMGIEVMIRVPGGTYPNDQCALQLSGVSDLVLHVGGDEIKPDLEAIIDGCCDTIFVATGCLMTHGVPDRLHLQEVCQCNEAKFPGGKVIIEESTGKYLKPMNWSPPAHGAIQKMIMESEALNVKEWSEKILKLDGQK